MGMRNSHQIQRLTAWHSVTPDHDHRNEKFDRHMNAVPAWARTEPYRYGLELLNQGSYFEAHEVLEEVWREVTGIDRQFLQGLIQVAVALHHHRSANNEGACSVLRRAAANLAPFPAEFAGIGLHELRAAIAAWQCALDDGLPDPPRLHIHLVDTSSG